MAHALQYTANRPQTHRGAAQCRRGVPPRRYLPERLSLPAALSPSTYAWPEWPAELTPRWPAAAAGEGEECALLLLVAWVMGVVAHLW